MNKPVLQINRGVVSGIDSIEVVNAYDEAVAVIDDIARDVLAAGGTQLIFNLKKMTYMTSVAIGQLIKIIKLFQKVDGQIYIYGVHPEIKQYLTETSLDKYFKFL
ncbi:MAG: STAS domain-containing protein [Chitinivibrionales bacterium]|nr:STAS domain-containing protein [Chitinivibrionales bacterium]